MFRPASLAFIAGAFLPGALQLSGTWSHPIRAPALPLACSGIPVHDVSELRGRVLRVMADAVEDADHPRPIPPHDGPGVIVLRLNRTPATEPAAHESMAATGAAREAYAIRSGLTPGALARSESLIDPGGWPRAAWLPDSDRGWPDPKQLITEVTADLQAPPWRSRRDS